MAVQASREVVIDAPPEVILEALADVVSVPTWSSVHKRAEVIDSYPDGRPHHVKVTIRVSGIVDTEVLEYHWGPDWVVWDAHKTLTQHAQHVEYTMHRETEERTRVRFEIHLAQPIRRQVGVDLGRTDVGVPEHLLQRTQIAAAGEQMSGERVAQRVGAHPVLEARAPGMPLNDLVEPLARQAGPAQIDEHSRLITQPIGRAIQSRRPRPAAPTTGRTAANRRAAGRS